MPLAWGLRGSLGMCTGIIGSTFTVGFRKTCRSRAWVKCSDTGTVRTMCALRRCTVGSCSMKKRSWVFFAPW
jgi:hypothetical protein